MVLFLREMNFNVCTNWKKLSEISYLLGLSEQHCVRQLHLLQNASLINIIQLSVLLQAHLGFLHISEIRFPMISHLPCYCNFFVLTMKIVPDL